jgi:YfiR/HmsC-like
VAEVTRIVGSLACFLILAAAGSGQENTEKSIKAAYVYKFTRYIEWPASTPCPPTLTIAVLGSDPVGDSLAQAVAGRESQGRALRTARFVDIDRLEPCSMVWVAAPEADRQKDLMRRLRVLAVVVVSDAHHFARGGGTIGLVVVNNRVGFEVNVQAADAVGLRVSSRLLGMARIVRTGEVTP